MHLSEDYLLSTTKASYPPSLKQRAFYLRTAIRLNGFQIPAILNLFTMHAMPAGSGSSWLGRNFILFYSGLVLVSFHFYLDFT